MGVEVYVSACMLQIIEGLPMFTTHHSAVYFSYSTYGICVRGLGQDTLVCFAVCGCEGCYCTVHQMVPLLYILTQIVNVFTNHYTFANVLMKVVGCDSERLG